MRNVSRYVIASLFVVMACAAALAGGGDGINNPGGGPGSAVLSSPGTVGDLVIVCGNGSQICDKFAPGTGVGDVAPNGLVIMLGLRRQVASYIGPLVNAVRASDSVAMDIQQDALGNLDQAMCAAFQGSSSLTVAKWYDQTINGNNAVPGAVAPTLICSVPQFGGLPAIQFGAVTGSVLEVPSSATWQGWMAGANPGTMLRTQYQDTTASGRAWEIGTSGTNHILELGSGPSALRFSPGASTSAGNFITTQSVGLTQAHVVDIQYQWTNVANLPIFTIDGTPATLLTSVAPIGSLGADTSLTFYIGNNSGSSQTAPFLGYYTTFGVWKSGPGAANIEAARKVDGAYYSITVN